MAPQARVCIVGAGASGLAALRVFLERSDLFDPVVYDATNAVGGVWHPSRPTAPTDDIEHPPDTGVYDGLMANVPNPLMAFNQDILFPPETSLFADQQAMLKYLLASVNTSRVRTGVRVTSIRPNSRGSSLSGATWNVALSTGESLTFDFVIVATGRYHYPIVPSLLRDPLRGRLAAGTAFHSAWFRTPQAYAGKSLLVVGGGPSGIDIATFSATSCPRVYWAAASTKNQIDQSVLPANIYLRERVSNIRTGHGSRLHIVWEENSRTWSETIDAEVVILATGYQLSYPFLENHFVQHESTAASAFPFASDGDIRRLVGTPKAVIPLAKQTFPLNNLPDASFAFIGLHQKTAPWAIMELQARAASVVFVRTVARRSNPHLSPVLNVSDERQALVSRYSDLRRTGGSLNEAEKLWHSYPGGAQWQYRRELAAVAGVRLDEEVLGWFEELSPRFMVIRAEWKAIEQRGEAARWLRGVGYGPGKAALKSWVDLMNRVYENADAQTRRLATLEYPA